MADPRLSWRDYASYGLFLLSAAVAGGALGALGAILVR